VEQFVDIVWNSGWRPIKPDGVEDPSVFAERGSDPVEGGDSEQLICL
jgi:hypothetical protein